MTIWDNIYKEKRKNGDTWATPSDRFYPLFKQFLKESNFEVKHALDIGCGVGKYLKILQSEGFKTDGVDSSETAVEMTKELLGDDPNIISADMFDFEIPKNKYDLVISILTIHHGTKKQVQDLIDQIHKSIIDNGKIFITVPDFESSKKWGTFKDHKKIGKGTFIPLLGPEKGLPHSFYTEEEVKQMFSKFKDIKLNLDNEGNWTVQASK
jgi:cyclopropane fatty-acyl-phospholipid synthase-like methyltransferase